MKKIITLFLFSFSWVSLSPAFEGWDPEADTYVGEGDGSYFAYVEKWFDPATGVFCEKQESGKPPVCAERDPKGIFRWAKPQASPLLRTEYRYDKTSKSFSRFVNLFKDGSFKPVSVRFDAARNAYFFCHDEGSTCEAYFFDTVSGSYRAGSVLPDENEPPCPRRRIVVIPFRWNGYAPRVTRDEIINFMENEFVSYIGANSCCPDMIDYEVAEWVSADAGEIDSLQDLITLADTAIPFDQFDTIYALHARDGQPLGVFGPSYGVGTQTFETDEGTLTFGWIVGEDNLDDFRYGSGPLYWRFVRSLGVLHQADAWECGIAVEQCGDNPDVGSSCEANVNRDIWEGKRLYSRSPEFPFSSAVRSRLGWTSLVDVDGRFPNTLRLWSLESCRDTIGIKIHGPDGRNYVADWSQRVNEDPFVRDHDQFPPQYVEGFLLELPWGLDILRPISEMSYRTKIAVRGLDSSSGDTLLLDMDPDSSIEDDLRDSLLMVGSGYRLCQSPAADPPMKIYPFYAGSSYVDLYIGPGEDDEDPVVSDLVVDPNHAVLRPSCLPQFDGPPLIYISASITDNTGVMWAKLYRTRPDGNIDWNSSLGEGVRTGNTFIWLVNPAILGEGRHELAMWVWDIFRNGQREKFTVTVEAPPHIELWSETEFVTLPPATPDDSTVVFMASVSREAPVSEVTLHRFRCQGEEVSLYNCPTPIDDPDWFYVMSGPLVTDPDSAFDDYLTMVHPASDDWGPGDYLLFARGTDVCGVTGESNAVPLRVQRAE